MSMRIIGANEPARGVGRRWPGSLLEPAVEPPAAALGAGALPQCAHRALLQGNFPALTIRVISTLTGT